MTCPIHRKLFNTHVVLVCFAEQLEAIRWWQKIEAMIKSTSPHKMCKQWAIYSFSWIGQTKPGNCGNYHFKYKTKPNKGNWGCSESSLIVTQYIYTNHNAALKFKICQDRCLSWWRPRCLPLRIVIITFPSHDVWKNIWIFEKIVITSPSHRPQ